MTASLEAWALERTKCSWKSPELSAETGHFTQLVWSNTTSVGCARRDCAGRNGAPGWFVACEYWPRGNVVWSGDGDKWKLFRENVMEQVEGKKADRVEGGGGERGGGEKEVDGIWGCLGCCDCGSVVVELMMRRGD